jgi:hypothetical protein
MLCLSCYAYVFSSTQLEKRAEQVLPGSEGGGGGEGGDGSGGRGEKWPKQCMNMWINELKKKRIIGFVLTPTLNLSMGCLFCKLQVQVCNLVSKSLHLVPSSNLSSFTGVLLHPILTELPCPSLGSTPDSFPTQFLLTLLCTVSKALFSSLPNSAPSYSCAGHAHHLRSCKLLKVQFKICNHPQAHPL